MPSLPPSEARPWRLWVTALAVLTGAFSCTRVGTPPPPAPIPGAGWVEVGVASWYGDPFHGRLTASGEVYDMEGMTAAHRTLPFGTVLRVDNLDNSRSATVTVNDRGPFVDDRIIDLSRRAARDLDMIGPGIARVRLTIAEAAPSLASCWIVQAGVFAERDRAEEIGRELEPPSVDVWISQGPDGLYRLRVGPFAWRPDAERLAEATRGMLLGCPASA